jgi:hypothetical protein
MPPDDIRAMLIQKKFRLKIELRTTASPARKKKSKIKYFEIKRVLNELNDAELVTWYYKQHADMTTKERKKDDYTESNQTPETSLSLSDELVDTAQFVTPMVTDAPIFQNPFYHSYDIDESIREMENTDAVKLALRKRQLSSFSGSDRRNACPPKKQNCAEKAISSQIFGPLNSAFRNLALEVRSDPQISARCLPGQVSSINTARNYVQVSSESTVKSLRQADCSSPQSGTSDTYKPPSTND